MTSVPRYKEAYKAATKHSDNVMLMMAAGEGSDLETQLPQDEESTSSPFYYGKLVGMTLEGPNSVVILKTHSDTTRRQST
ncbi:hypothetical protein PG994_004056 [Apiospora phragmitis]|uniref:Uncharacterized protein n=1 Tax=Apiospora phragmitis TaxID=2905665 RepID=A0ABR1VZV4_9PEZI